MSQTAAGMMTRIDDTTRRGALGHLIAAGSAVALGALPGSAWAAASDPSSESEPSEDAVLRDPGVFVGGNRDGDISLVEWFDYQCPYCRKLAPDLAKLVAEDGKLRMVHKDWPVLGAVSVVLTGIIGAIIVTPLMNRLHITDFRARGFAAGIAAHGIGTARAFQVDEVAGVFAGIAMALNALLTSLLVPVAVPMVLR